MFYDSLVWVCYQIFLNNIRIPIAKLSYCIWDTIKIMLAVWKLVFSPLITYPTFPFYISTFLSYTPCISSPLFHPYFSTPSFAPLLFFLLIFHVHELNANVWGCRLKLNEKKSALLMLKCASNFTVGVHIVCWVLRVKICSNDFISD